MGYHTGMEVSFVSGGFIEQGPAVAWLRMRFPLIAGEPTTPLARVLIAADSGNGVSSVLDYRRVFCSSPAVVGKRIGDLDLQNLLSATITRLRRIEEKIDKAVRFE